MTLNSLYKRLFLLFLVLGPFFWLMFTEDGKRRTDLVLLSLLKDSETMDIALAKLLCSLTQCSLLHAHLTHLTAQLP